MAIHEECGVFGMISSKRENIASYVYYGLYALQHRGQESCGIVVNDDGVFSSYKDLGLVSDVFSKDTMFDMVQPVGRPEITVSRLKSIIKKEKWRWHITVI